MPDFMPDDPPEPLPALRSRRRYVIGSVAVAAILLIIYVTFLRPSSGLTDDPARFHPAFADVMGRIQAENARVLERHPDDHVTIVLLLPLDTTDRNNPFDIPGLRHAMQGSHLAQLWRNREGERAGAPYIRLLVRDMSDDWRTVTADIERELDAQRIVAVTGLGGSTEQTKRIIDGLSRRPVAMSAAVLTSNELQGQPGLVRMAPLNTGQAVAGLNFVKRMRPPRRNGIVVQDANPQDSYTATLGKAFEDRFGATMGDSATLYPTLTYDGRSPSAAVLLDSIAQRVCASDVNVIFYAGRSAHLPSLLRSLTKQTGCAKREMNVITGDDAGELNRGVKEPYWVDPNGRIRLYYTALAHPDVLKTLDAIKIRFAGGEIGYRGMFRDPLDDGQAIMHHDALYAVIRAVDTLVAGGHRTPTTEEVAHMLRSGTVKVEGAGGSFTIDRDGNPDSKQIPVLRLWPYGRAEYTSLSDSTQ